jgi:nicotinamidase-related amidase
MPNSDEATLTIDRARTALILLHWQNDLVLPGPKHSGTLPEVIAKAHNIEHAEAVLKASREKGILVAYVNAVHGPGYPEAPSHPTPLSRSVKSDGALLRGTPGVEVVKQLKPLDNEVVVENFCPSAFYGTELDVVLRNKGVTHIVLTGMTTEWVVETTARDGACRGYFIYTLEDCCNSRTDDLHKWPMTNILPKLGTVIDSKAFIDALQNS